MQLNFYNYTKSKQKKQISIRRGIFYLKKTNNNYSNLIIFDLFNWIFLHSSSNSLLMINLQTFLKKTILIRNNIRYQNSRTHLLKIRIENSCFTNFLYQNWSFLKYKLEKNLFIPINCLQMIPWFKDIFASNLKIGLQKILNINYLKIFLNFNSNILKKKTKLFLNIFNSLLSNYINLKINKFSNFISRHLENSNLLSESFCSVYGLIYLIICKRKFYSRILLIRFIKTIFLKINYFRNLITIKMDKKKFQPKIDPYFSNFLRSEKNKIFIFYKLASIDFKVLPSKNHIPILFFLEIYEILGNIRQKFKRVKSTSTRNKCLKISNNKNFKIFDENNKSVLNQQINSLLEINWLFKKKNLKNGISVLINKKWSIEYVLIKESKDFYNETFGVIFISQIQKLFEENYLDLWLNSFYIYPIYSTTGLINVISNSISLHEINKKKNNQFEYTKIYEVSKKKGHHKFIQSLSAYSLFCFIFQLKDRHNGNILINLDNRLIHVDFGYILGHLPGNLKFEADSFKLSNEFMSKFNGKKTENFEYFRELFLRGFMILKKNFSKLTVILKSFSFKNDFKYNRLYRTKNFEKRLNLIKNEKDLIKYCLNLIEESVENWKTIQYDKYQLHASGIN